MSLFNWKNEEPDAILFARAIREKRDEVKELERRLAITEQTATSFIARYGVEAVDQFQELLANHTKRGR